MVPRLQIQVQIRLSTGYGAYLTFSVSLSSCPSPPCSCALCLKMYVSRLIEEKIEFLASGPLGQAIIYFSLVHNFSSQPFALVIIIIILFIIQK